MMNPELTISPPYQRLCKNNNPSIRIYEEDANLFVLGIFLQQKLKVVLNSGYTTSGFLEELYSDYFVLEGKRITFSDCSIWLSNCKAGMVTDIDTEMGVVKIIPGSFYGIDHSSVIYTTSGGNLMLDFSALEQSEMDKKSNYPILYGSDENGNIVIYGTGEPVPVIHFGEVVRYRPDFGAGKIVPESGINPDEESLIRFAAEDLTNASPASLNTYAFHYRVSYTLGKMSGHSIKAVNVYLIREIPIHPNDNSMDAQNTEDVLEACAKEATISLNASTEIVDLEPLREGLHYGILFYYRPEFHYINLFSWYKYRPVYGALTREESQASRLCGIIKTEDTFPPGVNLDTLTNIYVVSYGSDSHLDIHRVFAKSEVWMLRIVQNKMLIVYSSDKEEDPHTDGLQNIGEKPDETLELPPLSDGETYAILKYYARSKQWTYFHCAYISGISNDMMRSLTTAMILTTELQVVDANGTIQLASRAFNTMKYIYVVHISLGKTEPQDGGMPYVKGPISVVRSFVKRNYEQVRVDGSSVLLFSSGEMGIVRRMDLPPKYVYPDYVMGETLIVKTASGQRTISYSGPDSIPPDSSDSDGGVIRFGVLTDVFRDESTDVLTGICLNHNLYLSMNDLGEQARNIIWTSRKQMLLKYCRRDGIITADRLLSDDIWDIPWEQSVVKECVVSGGELSIALENGSKHFQTTDTDGYVNASARNGTLVGQSVYFKQILCPSSDNKAGSRLQIIAGVLHCVKESAFITYDQIRDEYYAWRYNLRTGALGTIKQPVFGSEKQLASALNTYAEITFVPFGNEKGELISTIPSTDEEEQNDIRRPRSEQDIDNRDHLLELTPSNRTAIMGHSRAETTEIGNWTLKKITKNPRYMEIIRYLDGEADDSEEIQRIEVAITALFASSSSEDMTIAAKLVQRENGVTRFSRFLQRSAPYSPHYFLRRSFRARVNEIVQSGDYQIGEFDTFMLPILDSDSTVEQRARDLFVFLLPCFNRSYSLKKDVLQNITRGSFTSETEPGEQEYAVKLQELFGEYDEDRCDVAQLLNKIVALDRASFDYLCDCIFSDHLPQNLRGSLLTELGVTGGAQNDQGLMTALQKRRQVFSEEKSQCAHLLQSAANAEETRLYEIIAGHAEWFQAIGEFLGQEDRNAMWNLRSICTNVMNSRRMPYADRMNRLQGLETSISKLRSDLERHPTPVMVCLFFRWNYLKRIHREIIDELNMLCVDSSSSPDVQCVPDYPILLLNQSSFILNLENGEAENDAGRDLFHRPAHNLMLTLSPKNGISSDNIDSQKKLVDSLLSGERISLGARINLDGISANTTLQIGYKVTYQYPDSFMFDESEETMITLWANEDRKGILTFTVSNVSENQLKKKQDVDNPYQELINASVPLDSSLFFGRKKETEDIMKYIQDKDEHLASGKIVFLYGQKQCGKTSFIKRIFARLKDNPNAVVLYFDDLYSEVCNANSDYFQSFSDRLASTLLDRMIDVLRAHCVPQLRKLGEHYASILAPLNADLLNYHLPERTRLFNRLREEIQKRDNGRYKIVLVIDEFTQLCKAIRFQMDSDPTCKMIPEFIRTYSEKGFIQIIIGHDSMMNLLTDLNVINRTTQTAQTMHLSALTDKAAESMICEPMKKTFGVDLYNTVSGKIAVRHLCDLSGRNPYYLVFLCSQMFKYYQGQVKNQMSDEDVNKMVREISDEQLMAKYAILFDPLLSEDFDDSRTKEKIYRFLCHVARETMYGNHECNQNTVCPGMSSADCRRIQKLLIDRDVLWTKDGRMGIKVGLFREYVRRL